MMLWVDGEVFEEKLQERYRKKALHRTENTIGNQGKRQGYNTGHHCSQLLSNESRYWLFEKTLMTSSPKSHNRLFYDIIMERGIMLWNSQQGCIRACGVGGPWRFR